MFQAKWQTVQAKLHVLQEQHFQQPADAAFCRGQELKENDLPSRDCYDPVCTLSKRHHSQVPVEWQKGKRHADGSKVWRDPENLIPFNYAEVKLKGEDREQLVVSELCAGFEAPTLRAQHQQWQPNELNAMFEDTAACLAMFLRDEVDGLEEQLCSSGEAELKLKPQLHDVLKVLWQKDLNSEGIYLNIATYIRRLSSCLLMLAIKRVSLRVSQINPKAVALSKNLRSPYSKVKYLAEHDPSAQPLSSICLLVDKLASAVVHHKDDADFPLASDNPGNTIIVICRSIIIACARFMDWHGWQTPSEPAPLDPANAREAQNAFKKYLSELKHELSPKEIEFCCVCMERPLTHAFVHRSDVHLVACELCATRCIASNGKCPHCNNPAEKVVKMYKSGVPTSFGHDSTMTHSVPSTSTSPRMTPTVPSMFDEPDAKKQKQEPAPGVSAEDTQLRADAKEKVLQAEQQLMEAQQELRGLFPGYDEEVQAMAAAEAKFNGLNLEDVHADAANVEQTAMQKWDAGHQESAVHVLEAALSTVPSSHPSKVFVILRLLEYSVQLLELRSTPQKITACQGLVQELTAVFQRMNASAPNTASTHTPYASMVRRFLFWSGRLQAAQGLHSEAAASTSHAVAAAKQGGGDLTRCLIETAQAYHAHAKLLDQVQALSPALDAAMRSLEFAHESGSKIHIIRAAVLGAVIHNRRAAAANQDALYIPALQLHVLALKQLRDSVPIELGVANAEGLLGECRRVFSAVKPLYVQEGSDEAPPAFVGDVEQVMQEAANCIGAAKAKEQLKVLSSGLDWLEASTSKIQSTFNALSKDTAWMQSKATISAATVAAANNSNATTTTTTNSNNNNSNTASVPGQPQLRPSQLSSSVARHLNTQRQALLAYWKSFDEAGFKGVPIPADETEEQRKLRLALTKEVYNYFEEAGRPLLGPKYQQSGRTPPFTSKMHAFAQMVGFRLYMGARNKAQTPVSDASPQQGTTEASAGPSSSSVPGQPQLRPSQLSSSVARHLNTQRQALLAYWKSFDEAGFKGVPIPANESNEQRQLRLALTKEVYNYFEEAGRPLLGPKYQQSGRTPPFTSKMHAFAQMVGFRLYMGAQNKAKETSEAAAEQVRVAVPV